MHINYGQTPMKQLPLALCLLLAGAMNSYAGPNHQGDTQVNESHQGGHTESRANNEQLDSHSDHGDDDHDGEEAATMIPPAVAAEHGISLVQAGPGTIERHLKVYGRLELPSDQHVNVQARFAGLIKSVSVKLGQNLAKGDVLAVVESNDSLKDYVLRAPIAGVVQSRQAAVGELTGSRALFTLVDTRSLWATLKVFSNQRFDVKPGLVVHIMHGNHRHDGRIESLAPASDGQPYVLARTLLDNATGDMAPGDFVAGEIDAEKVSVPLLVDNRALQTLNGKQVIFIHNDGRYTAREVSLGRSDNKRSEVLAGLQTGESYVLGNSYLLKADIEKSGAAHEH